MTSMQINATSIKMCFLKVLNCMSIRKLMSVVKDVNLEAMPTSIFLNDDDGIDIDDTSTIF